MSIARESTNYVRQNPKTSEKESVFLVVCKLVTIWLYYIRCI